MSRLFTMPDGSKVRSGTKRDYVLIVQNTRGLGTLGPPWIERRSDSQEMLKTVAGRLLRAGSRAVFHVGVMGTGELRRVGAHDPA
jgi:hypothetical protein